MSVSAELPEEARRVLEAGGLDVLGAADLRAWDDAAPPSLQGRGLLPEAAGVLVVGAGRALFEGLAWTGPDPLDRHTEAVVDRAVATLERAGHRARAVLAHRPAADGHADFVALGRAAGLGWPSRLGLLLHPERGPWWSLRAGILTDLALSPGTPLSGAGPCADCPAPCTAACPADAPRPEGFSVSRCGEVRRAATPCAILCHARRACPLGQGHAYPPAAEAHVMRASRSSMAGPASRLPLSEN